MTARKPYPNVFEKLTPPKAWVLGLWYSDGYVTKDSFTWCSALTSFVDPDLLCKAKSIIQDNSQPDRVRFAKGGREIRVYSVDFAQSLMARGVMPRKSKTMTWPNWLTDELLSSFVRGLWDGDGSVGVDRKYLHLTYTSGSLDFLGGMIQAISPAIGGFKPKLVRHPSNESWTFNIMCTRAVKLAQWLYEGSNACTRSDRKYARYQEWIATQA